ncbi:hypothetical protein CKK33_08725 [Mucilaginibacter sp. MD40]|uniref:hypothetical protein n=1 Tax=Mucilaginibacter sp. MD40 TaxID=2029590 RepID=UPI000BAC6D40|nr:hypothetical protein [Mucilaginibacter sp. MD40]PAW93573.1 hypothetical protein CKK33_08725 [Mucilaginibacter sp. MD40]
MKKILIAAMLCTIASVAFCQQQQQQQQGNRSADNDRVSNDTQWDPYPKSRTSEYKATALNTNFTIPLIRFNSTTGDPSMKGSVSLFNSIGAGFGINWGRMEVTTDSTGHVINSNMYSTFGLNLGVLFAANTNNGNTQNIFAPTLSISILNFQVGYGMELGTVSPNQKRGFVTIAYNIPVSKLIKGGFYILRRSKRPVDDTTSGQGSTRFLSN